MARARNIKPGFYKNEDLAECSVWARLVFPGLWMMADREGRLEDRPKRIKGELLPYDSQDVEPLLKELSEKKDAQGVPFIVRYQNSDGKFIQISKFSDHQAPHYSEKQSVIKPPTFPETPTTISTPISEKPPPIKRGSQPPDSLNPDSLNPDTGKKHSRADRAPPVVKPDDVSDSVWHDFTALRKAKNAPLSETAMAGIRREAKQAGMSLESTLRMCCERGWRGFKAEWVHDRSPASKPGEGLYERNLRAVGIEPEKAA